MSQHVGMSGLGRMGIAMAGCLLEAGFDVSGYDPDPERAAALAALGGTAKDSNRTVCEDADAVLMCLPSAQALHAALMDEDGLLSSTHRAAVLVEMSTLSVEDKLSAKGLADGGGFVLLDCPLSGGPPAARSGRLAIFTSGDEPSTKRCDPIFDALSHRHPYLGAFGNGAKMKLLANLLVAVHNVSTAEVLTLGQKAGLEPTLVWEALRETSGDSRMFQRRGPKMANNDFASDEGISLELFHKDLALIAAFARSAECPAPLFSAARELYLGALASGYGEADSSSVVVALRRLAGLDDS